MICKFRKNLLPLLEFAYIRGMIFLLVNKAQLVDVVIAISITILLINFLIDLRTGSSIDLRQLM